MDTPNLYNALKEAQEARTRQADAWYSSPFRRLLADNLMSSNPILSAPSEDYPRVRCYRGTGPQVALSYATVYKSEGKVRLKIAVDWVSADVSEFDEHEGCPGAPVQTVEHALTVPRALLENTTKAAFQRWLADERKQMDTDARYRAHVTIGEITQRFGPSIAQAEIRAARGKKS